MNLQTKDEVEFMHEGNGNGTKPKAKNVSGANSKVVAPHR